MQACLTKFFKNLGSDKPNYEYLFQKEEADRKQREEEERQRRAEIERRQAEEEERLYALYLERKERISVSRRKRSEEKKAAREAQSKSYTEGVEITKGVFLGNRLAALNSEWLCDNGITHVMNVTKDIQNYYLDERYPEDYDNSHPTSHVLVEEPEDEPEEPQQTNAADDATEQPTAAPTEEQSKAEENSSENSNTRIRYRRFAIEDSRDEELPIEEIEAAVRFVQSAHTGNDGRALIHCREGKSRSVTILLCYLMTAKRWPLQRAFNHVKERAPWINVNEGFLRLLMDMDLRLFSAYSIDFFDKQERKERIDYCELDFDEQPRRRTGTSTRGKKSAEKRDSEGTSSDQSATGVKLESVTDAKPESAAEERGTQVSAESGAAVTQETAVPSSSAEKSSAAMEIDASQSPAATEAVPVATRAVSEVTSVPSPTVPVAALAEELPQETAVPSSSAEKSSAAESASTGEEHDDKENGGDVQNVGATVLGKRKREKVESKASPAKKKKKVSNNLPEPKVNIMSFFKRVE